MRFFIPPSVFARPFSSSRALPFFLKLPSPEPPPQSLAMFGGGILLVSSHPPNVEPRRLSTFPPRLFRIRYLLYPLSLTFYMNLLATSDNYGLFSLPLFIFKKRVTPTTSKYFIWELGYLCSPPRSKLLVAVRTLCFMTEFVFL